MFKKILNKKMLKNEKGLTLIELLAVIVILAIVAAIAIPAIGNIINTQRDKAELADASTMISAAKIAYTDGSCKGKTGGGGATEDDLICDKGELEPFVEGIVLKIGDEVAYTSSKSWTVTRTFESALKVDKIISKLTTIKADKSGITAEPEDKLNEALGK